MQISPPINSAVRDHYRQNEISEQEGTVVQTFARLAEWERYHSRIAIFPPLSGAPVPMSGASFCINNIPSGARGHIKIQSTTFLNWRTLPGQS